MGFTLLLRGVHRYECMICYDGVRRTQPVWNCKTCYSVFHLPCIRKWASSSKDVSHNRAQAKNTAWIVEMFFSVSMSAADSPASRQTAFF